MITKPLRISRINLANPLTQGLAFFAPLNEMAGAPRDLVTGSLAGGTVPTWTARGMTCKQTTPPMWSTTAAHIGNGDFSAMYCGGLVSNANADNYALSSCNGAASTGMFNLGQNGYMLFAVFNGAAWVGITNPVNYPVNTAVNNIWVGVRKNAGTEFYLYLNGVQVAAATVAAIALATTGKLGCGAYNSGAVNTYVSSAERVAAGFWNRALSPAEVASISANPWQLLAQSSASRIMRLLTAATGFSGVSRCRTLAGISRGRLI